MRSGSRIQNITFQFPTTRLGKLMRASTIQAMMKLMLISLMVMLMVMVMGMLMMMLMGMLMVMLMGMMLISLMLMMKVNNQGILTFCDEFVPGDPPEYFFDKNPENFPAILELHRFH